MTSPDESWLGPSESSGDRARTATAGATRFSEGRELGAGGGGRVVEGRDQHLAREVALKIVGPDRPLARARLEREAAILVALEHPAIVPLYDLIERADGGLQLALRIVRGRSLEAALTAQPPARPAPIPIALVRHLARAAEAIAWAHHRGIVHRDLKPANVMIGEFGETQVIDWGLAARLDDRDDAPAPTSPAGVDDGPAHLTQAGAVLGTPRYMSPEQARGERVDARADVWALGAILFEVLAGRPAFDASDSRAVLDAVRDARVPSLRVLRPEVPADLAAIAHKAMSELERRYPDARAFVDDLNAWLDGRPVAAHRYALGQRLARFARRRRAPLALGVGALATVGAIAFAAGVVPERILDESVTASLREDLGQRDRHLGHALALESQALALAGRTPEAAATAARALALGPSPIARGVLAATQPWPRLEASLAIDGGACLSFALHPDGERWLCRTADALELRRGATPLWRSSLRSHAAAFVDDGAAVVAMSPGRRITSLAIADGAVRATFDSPCGDDLIAGSARHALVRSRSCASLVSGDGAEVVARGLQMQAIAVDGDGRWAILALDGTVHAGADGGVVVSPIDLDTPIDDVTAMAVLADGVALGTLRGELLRIDAQGHVVLRRALLRDVPITTLTTVPGLPAALVVTLDRGGPLVVAATTFQSLARLPEVDRGALVARAGGRFATLSGRRLARWAVDLDHVARLTDVAAITSFAIGDDALAIAHGTAVSWLARGDGAVIATRDVGDKVKSLALDRAASRVVWSADHAGVLGVATLPGLMPLAGPALLYSRRLAITDAGRVVALPYRPGLWVGDRDGAVFGDEVWVDLAVRGELAAVLGVEDEAVLFDLGATPRELARCPLADPAALALTPDGTRFVVAAVDGVSLVETADCALAAWLGGRPDGVVPRFTDVQVSDDGAFIAAGSREGDVLVWDRDGRLRGAVVVHAQRVAQLAFDPAARVLASAGWDGAIAFVDLATLGRDDGANVARVRAALGE